jgi:hypothetical protein
MTDDPELAKQMHRILFELKYLIPWGTISQYDSSGGGTPPDSKVPPGVRLDGSSEQLPHEFWQARWNHTFHSPREPESCLLCARGNRKVGSHGREKVVEEARADLDRWRHKPDVEVTEETASEFDKRIVAELKKGWTVDEVAKALKTTPRIVRRAETNAIIEAAKERASSTDDSTEDQRSRVLELAGKHLTERQICFSTGLSQGVVRRILGRNTYGTRGR